AGGPRYSFNRPQRQRVLVLDEHPLARHDGVGIGVLADLVFRNFLVLLVARLERNQLAGRRQGEEDRPGVHDGAVTAAPHPHPPATTPPAAAATAPSTAGGPDVLAPGSLAGLLVDAEQLVVVGDAEDQAVLDDRGVIDDDAVRVAPQVLGVK